MALSPIARGEIGLDEAIKLLWIGSDGRLNPYHPVARTEAFNLLVKTTEDAAAVGLLVHTCFKRGVKGQVHVVVPVSSFRPSPFVYVVVQEFVTETLSAGKYAWIMRADEFAKNVPTSGRTFQFEATPETDPRQSRYGAWRYESIELAMVIETALAELRAGGLNKTLPSKRTEVLRARRQLGLQ